jgi:hypothetical protein
MCYINPRNLRIDFSKSAKNVLWTHLGPGCPNTPHKPPTQDPWYVLWGRHRRPPQELEEDTRSGCPHFPLENRAPLRSSMPENRHAPTEKANIAASSWYDHHNDNNTRNKESPCKARTTHYEGSIQNPCSFPSQSQPTQST